MDTPPVIKLSHTQLAAVNLGLSQLDGVRRTTDSFQAFKYEQEVIWKIANNIDVVAEKLKRFDRAKKMLVQSHEVMEGMAVTPDNKTAVMKFMSELEGLEDKEVEIPGLVKLSREELNVGTGDKKNPIPPSTLGKLIAILEP